MKRTLILILTTLTIAGMVTITNVLVQAKPITNAAQTMQTANQLYESGQVAQAAQAYQQLVDQGFSDSALFYNLGNAYFKQDDLGRAILNYRRAAQLAPRDPDIKANLDLARSHAVDQLDPVKSEGYFSYLVRLTEMWLTIDEMAMGVLMLWVVFAVVLIAFAHWKRGSGLREGLKYTLIIIGFLLFAAVISLGSRVYLERTRPEAVVVIDEINVNSGPGSQYVTEFVLHSGAEVSLLEQRENWARLALPGGKAQGWVPTDAVVRVDG